jgi:hypothetical protein
MTESLPNGLPNEQREHDHNEGKARKINPVAEPNEANEGGSEVRIILGSLVRNADL